MTKTLKCPMTFSYKISNYDFPNWTYRTSIKTRVDILNGGTTGEFPFEIVNKSGMFVLIQHFYSTTGVSSWYNRQEKEIKGIQLERRKKMFLFVDNMTVVTG